MGYALSDDSLRFVDDLDDLSLVDDDEDDFDEDDEDGDDEDADEEEPETWQVSD